MTRPARLGVVALTAFALLVMVVQMAPLIIVSLVSLSPSAVFALPEGGLSWRWYDRLFSVPTFWRAMALSVEIAVISTAASLVMGVMFAIAVSRGRVPGAAFLTTSLLSPLMLPGLVLGIAMLNAYRSYGLSQAYWSLIVAHVVVTLPFIVRMVLAALERFDFTLIDAAQTLGLSYPGAIVKVMVPNLTQPIVTGAVFAFLASFDNYPVSMFLVDARTRTLPIQLLQFLEQSADPTLAAASTFLLVISLVAVLAVDRLIGLRRAALVSR